MQKVKCPTAHLAPPRFNGIVDRLIFGDNYKAMQLPPIKKTEFSEMECRVDIDEELYPDDDEDIYKNN